MLSHLDRKLWRDLRRMKGQALAVAMVMGCGLAMMIMARSLVFSLESTRREYYEANRFAEVFAMVKRAPNSLAARIKEIPGVGTVQPGISVQVTMDLPELDEPASGMVRSLPDYGTPELNRLFLRKGRWLTPGGHGEVLAGEAFANANNLQPGDSIAMLLHGRRQTFRIAGIVLSPEFIFESRPGAALPDNRTYGTFWMPYRELSTAFQLYGAFNYLSFTLEPGASERAVIVELDRLLMPYGGRGAFGRADHPSHIRVSDEIRVQTMMSIGFPIVFLSVAAFMINAVLSRLLNLQREQIAIMKAFGFTNRQIAVHYLKFAFVIVAVGTTLGGCGGMLLGYRLVLLYHRFFRFPDLAFHADRTAFPLALVVCTVAAVVGVFGAVRRAARVPPAEAMRPEPPANYRPALVERLLDRGAHRRMIGAEQRRPARLQEIGVAVAVDVGEIGALGARHRQRERMIEGEVVLHAAGNETLGLLRERLRADAALVEIPHHLRQAVGPERPDRLTHQLLETPIERVDVRPFGDAIASAHDRFPSASAMSSRTRARPALGSGLERMRRRSSASEAASSAATRAVVAAGSAPQHRAPWLRIR